MSDLLFIFAAAVSPEGLVGARISVGGGGLAGRKSPVLGKWVDFSVVHAVALGRVLLVRGVRRAKI